jgi:hypothetical protein
MDELVRSRYQIALENHLEMFPLFDLSLPTRMAAQLNTKKKASVRKA